MWREFPIQRGVNHQHSRIVRFDFELQFIGKHSEKFLIPKVEGDVLSGWIKPKFIYQRSFFLWWSQNASW